jgi:hypothetical protein
VGAVAPKINKKYSNVKIQQIHKIFTSAVQGLYRYREPDLSKFVCRDIIQRALDTQRQTLLVVTGVLLSP